MATDLATIAQADVVETIDGVEHRFPLLVADDHAATAAGIKAARVAAAEARAKRCGFDKIETYRASEEVEDMEVTISEVLDHLRTPAGARDAISRSMEKAGLDVAARAIVLSKLDLIDLGNLALRVGGIRRKKAKPEPVKDAVQRPLGGDGLPATASTGGSDSPSSSGSTASGQAA